MQSHRFRRSCHCLMLRFHCLMLRFIEVSLGFFTFRSIPLRSIGVPLPQVALPLHTIALHFVSPHPAAPCCRSLPFRAFSQIRKFRTFLKFSGLGGFQKRIRALRTSLCAFGKSVQFESEVLQYVNRIPKSLGEFNVDARWIKIDFLQYRDSLLVCVF